MYRLNPWAKHGSSYAKFCFAENWGHCTDAFGSYAETRSAAPPKPPAIETHCCARSLRETPMERKGKEWKDTSFRCCTEIKGCCAGMGCSCAETGSAALSFGRVFWSKEGS